MEQRFFLALVQILSLNMVERHVQETHRRYRHVWDILVQVGVSLFRSIWFHLSLQVFFAKVTIHARHSFLYKENWTPFRRNTFWEFAVWCFNFLRTQHYLWLCCIVNSSIFTVDGGWSVWSQWNSCSKSCGTGLQQRSRNCTQPAPMHNGKPCEGEPWENRPCNVHACPGM